MNDTKISDLAASIRPYGLSLVSKPMKGKKTRSPAANLVELRNFLRRKTTPKSAA